MDVTHPFNAIDGISNPVLRRWVFNAALFMTLVVAAGVLIGFSGAVGGANALTGEDSRVVHYPSPGDPPGTEITYENQSDGPAPLLFPLFLVLTLLAGAFIGLPLVLVGLGIAELLARAGASQRVLRVLACVPTVPVALLMLVGADGMVAVIPALTVLAFVVLVRLPEQTEFAAGTSPPPAADPGSPPRRSGWLAPIVVSCAFAVACALWVLLSMAWAGHENGPCGIDGARSGIFSEIPEAYRDESLSFQADLGELRALPPGVVCRAYASPEPGAEPVLAADRTYPDGSSYIWIALFVVSPLVLWPVAGAVSRLLGERKPKTDQP